MDPNLDRARSRTARRRSSPWSAAVLGGVLLLAACGGDAVDPTEAETGILQNSVPPDPAVSPVESDDPLTGSEP